MAMQNAQCLRLHLQPRTFVSIRLTRLWDDKIIDSPGEHPDRLYKLDIHHVLLIILHPELKACVAFTTKMEHRTGVQRSYY